MTCQRRSAVTLVRIFERQPQGGELSVNTDTPPSRLKRGLLLGGIAVFVVLLVAYVAEAMLLPLVKVIERFPQ